MTTFNHQDGHYFEVDGARLYCEQQGNPHGPALVFLHGGFGDIETFNAITPALADRYRLIGIDSRGQGKSTLGDAPLTYARLQQDVEAIAHQLGLEHFSLIGHSDGGIAALRIAAAKVCRIDKLVTLGAHWQLQPDDPVRGMYSRVTGARWRELFPHSHERYLSLNPVPDFDRLALALRALWLDTSEHGYPNETVRDITAELLVIRGDEDRLVSRMNACELADRVVNARLLNVAFTDHSPHEHHPQWLLPALATFLG